MLLGRADREHDPVVSAQVGLELHPVEVPDPHRDHCTLAPARNPQVGQCSRMSHELANAKVRGMARERHGIARVRYVVDWFRGLGALVLLGVIGVAAFRAGGWQGWLLGALLLLLLVAMGVWDWARRD